MALRIEWSDEASQQLDQVIEYLEVNWTEKELIKFFQRLEKKPFGHLFKSQHLQGFYQTNRSKRISSHQAQHHFLRFRQGGSIHSVILGEQENISTTHITLIQQNLG